MYCGPLGRGPLKLVADWATAPAAAPDWPEFRDRRVLLTHRGRSALWLLVRLWKLGPCDEVLLPAYHCGSEVHPFVACGAKVILYRIDEQTCIDMVDLLRRTTDRTRVIYVIHYFGWPRDLSPLRSLCDRRGVRLVEDCALSLFSGNDACPIGQGSDAAIFSFPKSLAVPDGGALSLAMSHPALSIKLTPPSAAATFRRTLPLIKRQAFRIAGGALRMPAIPPQDKHAGVDQPDIPPSYYSEPSCAARAISRVSRGVIASVDRREVIVRRRRNYLRLLDMLGDVRGLRPLHGNLPESVCPLGFPVVVDRRNGWVSALRANAIDVSEWWAGYHRALDLEPFPDSRMLKRRLLLLPVHQQLGDEQMDYIARTVQRLAGRAAGERESGGSLPGVRAVSLRPR